jgi:hypothetical protein
MHKPRPSTHALSADGDGLESGTRVDSPGVPRSAVLLNDRLVSAPVLSGLPVDGRQMRSTS